MSLVSTLSLVLAVTVGIGFAAGLLAWRERDEPGALPLVGMFGGQCLWVSFSLLELQAPTFEQKILFSELVWVGVVIIPVAWLLFSLEYTGRDRYIKPRNLALLLSVPAVTVVLALTSTTHELLYVDSTLAEYQGHVFLDRDIGPWAWLYAGYTYLLGALGAIPLFKYIRSEARSFRGQSGTLLFGTLVPWVVNVLFHLGVLSIPAFDPTPVAFLVSGITYLSAVTRFRMFETNPSASQHARQLLIDQLQEGAVVVDTHGFVVDLNDSAETLLGLDRQDALGQPAAEVIADYENLTDGRIVYSERDGRPHDVTRTEIVDSRNRAVGSIFTFHDISEHVRNQQRHEVLNRLLRHNVRTQTNLIISHAELLQDGAEEGEAELVKRSANEIQRTADQARELIDLFKYGREQASAVDLGSLLEDCVDRVNRRYPAVQFELEQIPRGVAVSFVLETPFVQVLDNAAAHNDAAEPLVRVRAAERDDETVEIEIADNGPGIDSYEKAVIDRGTENELQHGSGLGLWLVKWGTEIAGGSVGFDAESTGTVVSITVPKRGTTQTNRPDQDLDSSV